MAGFTVTCGSCDRVFSPKAEQNLYDRTSRCYICSQCLSRTNIKSPTFKPRGKTGTGLRIGFGILFVLSAFSSIGDGDGTWLTCLVIGLALLAWQFWPQLWGLVRQKQNHAEVLQLLEDRNTREAQRMAQELSRKWVCSHCGATTAGRVCEYCGMLKGA